MAGGYRPGLVVGAGPPAQVWVHGKGSFGGAQLPVEAIDSVCLHTSCEVPVSVAARIKGLDPHSGENDQRW